MSKKQNPTKKNDPKDYAPYMLVPVELSVREKVYIENTKEAWRRTDIDHRAIGVEEYVLRQAARDGNLRIVKYQIETKGADIHSDKEAALRWATTYHKIDVVRYLLKQGANYKVFHKTADAHLRKVCETLSYDLLIIQEQARKSRQLQHRKQFNKHMEYLGRRPCVKPRRRTPPHKQGKKR